MTAEQIGRWEELLSALASLIPDDAAAIVIDGERHTATVADRLTEHLQAIGRPCVRLTDESDLPTTDGPHHEITLADGPHHRAHPPARGWDAVIWLRTATGNAIEAGAGIERATPGDVESDTAAGRAASGGGAEPGEDGLSVEPGGDVEGRMDAGHSASGARDGGAGAGGAAPGVRGGGAAHEVSGGPDEGVGTSVDVPCGVPDGGVGAVGIGRGRPGEKSAEADADIVIDMQDAGRPVIRHVVARLAGRSAWYVTESRAFFATRAETWDAKFGDDMPAYEAAVAEAGIESGGTALDVGCGTGRALPSLRAAVGARGNVIGLDITPEMLAAAKSKGRAEHATLVLADARHLPIADAQADAVFAAGLVTHLPDVTMGLAELARVTRLGGKLVVFHPSGRAALAARHGRELRPDEPLAKTRLGLLLSATGWKLSTYDDPPHRFFALAARV